MIEVALQQVRVRGGDAFAVQRRRAVPGFIHRGRQRQAAAAEVETTQGEVARVFALSAAAEQLFFQHVFADNAEVDNTVHHQARDIVITHAQNVDWHIFRQRNQTLGVQIDFNAAAAE